MTPAPQNPTAEDVGRVLAWALRHRRTARAIVWSAVGLVVAAASTGAAWIYQRQRAVDDRQQMAATISGLRETVRALDDRVRVLESQKGVVELVGKTLAAMRDELTTVRETVARLDGYFRVLPMYQQGDRDDTRRLPRLGERRKQQ